MVSIVASLAARNAREQWEIIFNQNYIQPVLQVCIAYSQPGLVPFNQIVDFTIFLVWMPLTAF